MMFYMSFRYIDKTEKAAYLSLFLLHMMDLWRVGQYLMKFLQALCFIAISTVAKRDYREQFDMGFKLQMRGSITSLSNKAVIFLSVII